MTKIVEFFQKHFQFYQEKAESMLRYQTRNALQHHLKGDNPRFSSLLNLELEVNPNRKPGSGFVENSFDDAMSCLRDELNNKKYRGIICQPTSSKYVRR